MLRNYFCALGLVAALCVYGFAEESASANQVFPTVYSEFLSASATLPELSVASVYVLQAEFFPADALSVADVVEWVPSVQIQQTGELGSFSSISVRGAPSQQTQVYVDGILQTGVSGEGSYLQQIPLSDVERIEVYASSLPGQFTQATPGGAINIVRKKRANRGVTFTAGKGSFGQHRLALLGSWQQGNWQITGFTEQLKSDNNFTYINDNGTPDYADDDAQVQRNHAGFESMQASVNVAYQTENQRLYLGLEGYDSHKELPHWNNLHSVRSYYQKQGQTATAGISTNQWFSGIDSSLRWQHKALNGHFSDPNADISFSPIDSFDQLESHQWQHHSLLSTNLALFTLSNEWQQDSFTIRNTAQGKTLDAQRTQVNSGAGSEWFLGDRVTLASTLRHAWWVDEQPLSSSEQQNWGIHTGLRFDNGTQRWQINAQRSTRQPTLIERFGNQGVFLGNPDLVSEQAWSIDTTFAWADEGWQWQSDFFYRFSSEAIAPVYNSQGIGRYINLDQATFWGTEWLGALQRGAWSLRTSGSLLQGMASSSLRAYDNRQVPGFYPISTTQMITWSPRPHWTTNASYLFEYGLYYDRANSSMAPEKHQVDAGVQWQRAPFKLSLDLRNLTDRAHKDYSRKALPGRSAVLTAQFSLGGNQ